MCLDFIKIGKLSKINSMVEYFYNKRPNGGYV